MIVITGAAGFIGCNIARRLNDLGETDLLLVDELGTSGKWKNLVELQYVDYLEKEDLMGYLGRKGDKTSRIRGIFHMGACSSTTESDASYLIKNNFEYTKELAIWSVNHKCPFIYASSAATYGDGAQGYSDGETEIHHLKPLNMYGYSKQMFDLWARSKNMFSKIVGLKFFNVYGPWEFHKDDMRSMVLKAYEQILETGTVKLFKSDKPEYADGEQMRDFIYVKDAVDMTLFFFENGMQNPGLYNVGTGKARTWVDMMNAIFKSMSVDPHIEFIPMPEVLREKYQYFTEAPMDKIIKAGYSQPIRSLEEGVADYIEFLREHNPA